MVSAIRRENSSTKCATFVFNTDNSISDVPQEKGATYLREFLYIPGTFPKLFPLVPAIISTKFPYLNNK